MPIWQGDNIIRSTALPYSVIKKRVTVGKFVWFRLVELLYSSVIAVNIYCLQVVIAYMDMLFTRDSKWLTHACYSELKLQSTDQQLKLSEGEIHLAAA